MGGRPKSFLEIGGVRIIDRQLAVLRPLFPELIISANEPALFSSFGLPVVPDSIFGKGPLAGILAVLECVHAQRVMVVACDMPCISSESLAYIARESWDEDIVVPVVGERPEPLYARYSSKCISVIRAQLATPHHQVIAILDSPSISVRRLPETELRKIDPKLGFLTNWNSPESCTPT